MSRKYRHGRPTIGVLAGWQFAWTATPLSYLDPIFQGASVAAHDLVSWAIILIRSKTWRSR